MVIIMALANWFRETLWISFLLFIEILFLVQLLSLNNQWPNCLLWDMNEPRQCAIDKNRNKPRQWVIF